MLVDSLTKALPRQKHERFIQQLYLVNYLEDLDLDLKVDKPIS